MRAKSVNEKMNFTEDSDPIRDMGIGGVILDDVHEEIEDEATDKWLKILNDSLVGKTITGSMMRWKEKGHTWEEFTIKVKRLVNTKERSGFESEVSVIDETGSHYTIIGDEKITIKDAS